jgi:hypothetical protein
MTEAADTWDMYDYMEFESDLIYEFYWISRIESFGGWCIFSK